jgi:hypothetical protein
VKKMGDDRVGSGRDGAKTTMDEVLKNEYVKAEEKT